jgi:PAS domain S-box-containing protein
MAKPIPKIEERKFDISELFFSTTNSRGVILNGNDVFVRVSGYSLEQLIGAPHSIIRHPDMPRIVFKLLWDTIQTKNMIAAYVKNMAADGTYYWVLAVVFPVGNDYLSIRLKPSAGLCKAAETIYAEVLKEEEKNGMEASAAVLFKHLKDAGFNTYEDFMKAVLVSELNSRDSALSQSTKQSRRHSVALGQSLDQEAISSALAHLQKLSESSSERYKSLFARMSTFESSSLVFKDQVSFLLDTFHNIQLLALNMRIYAGKIGAEGASLGVIATSFRDLVESIEQKLTHFAKMVDDLNSNMQSLTIKTASLKIQIDMVDFFVNESLSKVTSGAADFSEAFAILNANSEMFTNLAASMNLSALDQVRALDKSVKNFSQANLEIRKFVNGIELISQLGAVESARISAIQEEFRHNISAMQEFGVVLRESTNKINSATRSFDESLKSMESNFAATTHIMRDIFESTLKNQAAASASSEKRSLNWSSKQKAESPPPMESAAPDPAKEEPRVPQPNHQPIEESMEVDDFWSPKAS